MHTLISVIGAASFLFSFSNEHVSIFLLIYTIYLFNLEPVAFPEMTVVTLFTVFLKYDCSFRLAQFCKTIHNSTLYSLETRREHF